jgi:hypothetical protein
LFREPPPNPLKEQAQGGTHSTSLRILIDTAVLPRFRPPGLL